MDVHMHILHHITESPSVFSGAFHRRTSTSMLQNRCHSGKTAGNVCSSFSRDSSSNAFALFRFIGLDSAGSLLTPQLTLSQSVCKIFNGGSSLRGKIAFSLGLWAPSQSAEAEKWPVGNFPIYSNTEFLDLLSA